MSWQNGLSLILSLTALAWAAPESEPFIIQTNRPARVYYRPDDAKSAGSPFREAQARQALSYVAYPEFGQVLVKAEDEQGLVLWSDSASIPTAKGFVQLALKPGPHWKRILPLGLLVGIGMLAWWRRSHLKKAEALALSQEPLIRSDGELPRRRVAGYRLVKKLGSGAMGVVYLGEDDRGLQVAIKVPMPQLAGNPDFSERFQRELQLGMQLRHPRIVQLLALPVEEESYLIMEFIPGQPLESVPLLPLAEELSRCRAWATQILEALSYIHGQGIIHRDLKPANIMVLPSGDIKLMDFGVAHTSDRTRLTATGTVLGTPTYMAPEQLQGSPCDPSIDIYALGLILYERLNSGKLPYPTDFMALLRDKLKGPLPSLRGSLPDAWADFLQDLSAHSAAGRPSAAEALLRLRSL
ncbi:MAG: serine/threonine-protein kinase [Vulcanimicrobiota bacterium]